MKQHLAYRTWDLGHAFFWAMVAGALYLLSEARSGSDFPGAMTDGEIVLFCLVRLSVFAAVSIAITLIRNVVTWLIWRRRNGT
jgi:hypothetical protein